MTGYILDGLRDNQNDIRMLYRDLRTYTRWTGRIALFAAVMTAKAIYETVKNRKRDRQFEKMAEEIKELKRRNGG